MPLYSGEGVNMAMQDAFELTDRLAGNAFPDIQVVLTHFEKQMLSRTFAEAGVALHNTEVFHSENALEKVVGLFERR
jgi:2-polyprenyl-6-methoxyphenol hydroxylase-like FAD-dependent oxidoreductase